MVVGLLDYTFCEMIKDFRLQVFVVTAQQLSFTRAAQLLNISQPAVTKQIKELERQLSVALFRREGNRITLTSDGERLLPLAQEVLLSYEAINESICSASGNYSGALRIGASTTIAQYILPNILVAFRKSYPAVELSVVSGNSEEVLAELSRDQIDLAMVEDSSNSPLFHYELFAQDKILLLSHNKRPQRISVAELKNLKFVLRESGSGTLAVVEKELHRHNITRRDLSVEMQLGSSEGIIRYLMASKCYAFISSAAVADHLTRGDLYVTDVDELSITRDLRFATLHGHTHHLAELFKTFCYNY